MTEQHDEWHRPLRHIAAGDLSADEVRDCFPPTYGTVTELRAASHPDGPACRLETGAAELEDLAWYLARLPGPFVVESPDALRDRLAAMADRLRYSAGPRRTRD